MTARAELKPGLRPPTRADRPVLERMLRATGFFRDDEVDVALEVFDASLVPGQQDYETLGAVLDGALAGWICWGPTPCTEGTYDLYWIVVDPAAQRAGVGRALIAQMERRLAGRARMLVVETGGRDLYAPTQAFYRACGYTAVAHIPDFYAPGDHQIVYTKPLGPSSAGPQGR